MPDLRKDDQAAFDFLRRWAPDGPWIISAVDPERKKEMITQSFVASSAPAAQAFIKHWNGRRNLYFTVNAVRELMDKKPAKEDVGWMIALHVDIDPEQGVDHETEKVRILNALTGYDPPPSIIIFSGGGYQGFWLLREAVEVTDIDELESYNRKIEKDLGGDHCYNLDRIMRLPGTVNIPDARKRKKGRETAVAGVVHADWDRLYELGNFEQWTPPKTPRSSPRGDPAGGSGPPDDSRHKLPDWAKRVLENGPDHEGPRSYDGDRSKAAWAVCCAMIRANWTRAQIEEALLDRSNKISEHVYDQSKPEAYARRQAERAYDYAGGDFQHDEKGKPYANQHNVRVALSKLEVSLSFDEFSRRLLMEGPDGAPRRRVHDPDVNSMYLRIARDFGFRPSVELFKMIVEDECRAHAFNPLKAYLDSLRWDGEPRINDWLIKYGKAADTPLNRAISSIVLIAAVRRARQPGCKYDEIVVLESPQGFDKSTALSVLATRQEWFTDSMPLNATDKELIESLEGKWIIESAELKGMKKSEVEHHKAMLSRQYDRARLSYDKFVTEVPRQCVFFGSTNADSYLRDTTGNRRFWPVKTGVFDTNGLRRVVDQLWAEAAQREAAGESIRLDPSLYEAATLEQARRAVDDPFEALLERTLNGYDVGKILAFDIWNIVDIPPGMRTQEHNVRLGEAMRNLGWERKKLRFNGKPAWAYAKGDSFDQQTRILIYRDPERGLVVEPEGEEGDEKVGNEIPF